MKKSIIEQLKENILNTKRKRINVRLDAKTFTTIWDLSSLKVWKVKYPDAKIITHS